MLTLNSNFDSEFAQAEVEAVLLVEIYVATGDPNPYAFCTGSEGMTFSGIYNEFTGGTTGARDVFPLVSAVTPINMTMDPYDRTTVKNSVTVTLANHPYIRKFIKDNRLHARAIAVRLGTRNLTDQLHWANVFMGCIEGISPREDGIDLECQDFYRWRGEAITEMWTNKHPLEVIKQLLLAQGIPEEYIDDDMFDPTHADYEATIGHYCITHSGHLSGGRHGPVWVDVVSGPGHWRVDMANYDQIQPYSITIQFDQTIQDLVKMLVGSLYFGEDGQVRFVRFNTSTAAVAAWTDTDIRDFNQKQTIIVNQIEMSVTGERPDYGEPYRGGVTLKDATSQSNHAYPGESVGTFLRSDDFPGINWHGEVHSTYDTTGALSPLRVYAPLGMSGCRVPDGVYSHPWETMQDSEAKLSGSKPLYVLVNDEVMKCISLDLVEYNKLIVPNVATGAGLAHKPMFADLTITAPNRGQLSTTAAVIDDPWVEGADGAMPMAKVFDVTMHRDFALTQLQRFSNGCEVIELTTSLAQWAVQLGDFVTITNDGFLAYGFDGVDSGHKWEIIEKELTLDDHSAHIKWTLAYATESSPPAISATYTWPDLGVRGPVDAIPAIRYADESEVGVSRHTVMGLGATTSGLNVTIGRGAAGGGSKVVPLNSDEVVAVEANKDHYFSFDLKTSRIAVQTVTAFSQQPDLGRFSVALAKIDAGASSCVVTDHRSFGAVRPRNLSTKDFESGGNICPNPDFESWSRGPGYPPDGWEMGAGTWGTDVVRGEDDPASGLYGVKVPVASKSLVSKKFRIEPSRTYHVGATVFGSVSALEIYVGVRWYTGRDVLLSTTYAVSQSGLHSALTRKDLPLVAPSNASYAAVLLLNGAQAGYGLYDAIRFVRGMPSFFVTNTTQTITKGSNTVIDFDTETHDTGSSFTVATNRFVAPFDGVYQFNAQILGSKLTNGHEDSYIFLGKNGSELLRGSKSYTGTSATYDYHITSGPVKLLTDDYIQVLYHNAHSSDSVLTGSTTQNYFTGAQTQ